MAKSKKQNQTSQQSTYPKSYDRIVGLDLSLTSTGFAVWHCKEAIAPTCDIIDTEGITGLARMDHILARVCSLLGKEDEQTLYVIEDFSFASKGAALFQIAGLGYLIRYYFYKQQLPFILVPPTVLKKFVTGVGNADKSVILKEVYKRWGADLNDDNMADAYGLARIGRALAGWDTELTQFQQAALKQLGVNA